MDPSGKDEAQEKIFGDKDHIKYGIGDRPSKIKDDIEVLLKDD